MKALAADEGRSFVAVSREGSVETKRAANEDVAVQEFCQTPGIAAESGS